ncbi:MAG: hypothetical protein R6V05_04500 [Candidatus Brocadiia bacterium]
MAPKEAIRTVAKALRPSDAVCVGIYDEDKPDMLADDVQFLRGAVGEL